MTLFRYRNHLRRWAAFALLLWLWAIGSGVAHACLAPQLALPTAADATAAGPAGHDAHDATAAADPMAHDPAPLGHAVCSDDAGDAGAGANCADFCVKASVSIAPLKSVLDDGLAQALLLPTAAAVITLPSAAPTRQVVLGRDAGTALLIPIPIAFLRMTR